VNAHGEVNAAVNQRRKSHGLPKWTTGVLVGALLFAPVRGRAQDEAPISPAVEDSTAKAVAQAKEQSYRNEISGELTPGKGFDLFKSKRGSLNISFYGLFRYVNQLPASQTYTDHLGRERDVKENNMINWHRTFVWLTGHFLRSEDSATTSPLVPPTTQQTLLVRKPSLHREPSARARRRDRSQSHRPAPCRVLAVLGVERSPDGRRISSGEDSRPRSSSRASLPRGSTTPQPSRNNLSQLG
jgi:hypothetical protein